MLFQPSTKVRELNLLALFRLRLAIVTVMMVMTAGFAVAQNNRPGPQRPQSQGTSATDRGAATDLPPGDVTVVPATTRPNRSRTPREGSPAAIAKAAGPTTPKADRDLIEGMILFEDDDVLVLNKPFGIAVQGGTGTPGPSQPDTALGELLGLSTESVARLHEEGVI